MTENSVQIGSDGTTTTLDKRLYCSLIGHSNVYEQDLELKNSFTAETTGAGTVKYVYKGEDLGLDDEGNALGVKKLYVDPNPNVVLGLKNSTSNGNYRDSANGYSWQYTVTHPNGTKEYKYIQAGVASAGVDQTISVKLTNSGDPAVNDGLASALIAGVLEVQFPSWVNDGLTSDAIMNPQPGTTILDDYYQLQKGRKEGFVSSELRIPDDPAKTGAIRSVIIEGYKYDTSNNLVRNGKRIISGQDLANLKDQNGDYVIDKKVWETPSTTAGDGQDTILLPAKFTVIFENFHGDVDDANPVNVELKGAASYGGEYRFEASFHTEEKRPQDVTDRVPKNDDGTDRIRKAGEYYAEAKDVFCAVLKSANNAYLVADSYYKAYQDVADRAKLMGYDQHDQTI